MKPGPTELTPQRMIAALEQIREAADGALSICRPLERSLTGQDNPELVEQVCAASAGIARAIVENALGGLPHTVTYDELLKGKEERRTR